MPSSAVELPRTHGVQASPPLEPELDALPLLEPESAAPLLDPESVMLPLLEAVPELLPLLEPDELPPSAGLLPASAASSWPWMPKS